MKLYKLTDCDGMTMNETRWGPGVTHTAPGDSPICGPGWIHAWRCPLLAVIMNPAFGRFDPRTMRLWECVGEPVVDDYVKVGCTTLTTLREIPRPEVELDRRVRFGILAARTVWSEKVWIDWSESWLSGIDRSAEAAQEGRRRAEMEDWIGWRAAYAAAEAAEYAAYARDGIKRPVDGEDEAEYAARVAAEAAAGAAHIVRYSGEGSIDLVALAREATR